MSFPFTLDDIATATKSHRENVVANWPFIEVALKEKSITAIQPVIAAIATAGVECHFVPIRERGNKSYFQKMYSHRSDYELDASGLWLWRGRGFIQLTGLSNYRKYSHASGSDLVRFPDAALQPEKAARILVAYLEDHGCFTWASRGHWQRVRELVNGGKNGWDEFSRAVYELLTIAYK